MRVVVMAHQRAHIIPCADQWNADTNGRLSVSAYGRVVAMFAEGCWESVTVGPDAEEKP